MSSRISGLTYPRRKAAHERSETTWPPAYHGPTWRRSSRAIIAPASSVRAPTYTSVLFQIPMGTDREGFEPSMPLRAYRFSRPAVSTAHPPLPHPYPTLPRNDGGGQGGVRTHRTVGPLNAFQTFAL